MAVKDGDFLIYGGLTIEADNYLQLSNRIWEIRKKYGVGKEERLKFNPGPKCLDHSEFISLKSELIQAAIDHDCKFLVYHALHEIVQDVDEGRRNGINEICLNFSYLLKRDSTSGMVLLDRFNDKGNKIEGHLTEKFSVGLTGLPSTKAFQLSRIVGLHYSAIGQSHMPSLIDIVLGSYRFALNCHCREKVEHAATSKTILEALRPLFPRSSDDTVIPRMSISFSPIEVRVSKYRSKYVEAIRFLKENGLEVHQSY